MGHLLISWLLWAQKDSLCLIGWSVNYGNVAAYFEYQPAHIDSQIHDFFQLAFRVFCFVLFCFLVAFLLMLDTSLGIALNSCFIILSWMRLRDEIMMFWLLKLMEMKLFQVVIISIVNSFCKHLLPAWTVNITNIYAQNGWSKVIYAMIAIKMY